VAEVSAAQVGAAEVGTRQVNTVEVQAAQRFAAQVYTDKAAFSLAIALTQFFGAEMSHGGGR
jgi:hypothetical protein